MIDASNTIPTVTYVIQQALTPVFLLTGVGAILNVLAGRLVRAVHRYRSLIEIDIKALNDGYTELLTLPHRVHLIRLAISLCTLCALLVCVSIITLFLGAELGVDVSRVISILFIAAMSSLTGGLLCFLREIILAAAAIEYKKIKQTHANKTT
jgi:hypothetical protein